MLLARTDAGLVSPRAAPVVLDRVALLGGAAAPSDLLVRAFARVIADRCQPFAPVFVPGLGLGRSRFNALMQTYFPYLETPRHWLAAQAAPILRQGVLEEFDDLLQLLLEHGTGESETQRWTAHLVAAACMGDNHLWQDLGLPNRQALSHLLQSFFPQLAAKNTGDMKWKKFFYKQLCERADIPICKSPSCQVCSDYDRCFGPEEGPAWTPADPLITT
jgi:nitrogen fixation protein NifQ